MQDEDEKALPSERPEEPFEESGEDEPFDEPYAPAGDKGGYTTSDFHNVIQKQVVNATYDTLVESKLHWGLVEPFLHAAREMCRGDFRRTGRVQIHGTAAEGERCTEAEEAYVSLSIADQDDGREWLAQTWWLSDIVLAGADPAQVREAARALERTTAKLDAWLSANEKGPDEGG
jgi:hypothetical protein